MVFALPENPNDQKRADFNALLELNIKHQASQGGQTLTTETPEPRVISPLNRSLFNVLKTKVDEVQNSSQQLDATIQIAPTTKASPPGMTSPPITNAQPKGTTTPPPTPEKNSPVDQGDKNAAFNSVFGPSSYEKLDGFFNQCKPLEGCAWQSATMFMKGAQDFVQLRKELPDPKSPQFTERLGGVKHTLSGSLERLIAQPGKTRLTEMKTATDPVMNKVFTEREREDVARRAAAQDGPPEPQIYLGTILNRRGASDEARESFARALAKDPKNADALSGRALSHYNMGNTAAAAKDARAALTLKPKDEQAFTILKLSETRAAAGAGIPQGLEALQESSGAPGPVDSMGAPSRGEPSGGLPGASGDASQPQVQRAASAMKLRDYKTAIEAAQKALELNPRNVQARALASMAYSNLKDYPNAERQATEGLTAAPGNSTLLNARAYAQNRMKGYRAALESADEALRSNPRDAVALANRAFAQGGLGDRNGMMASLESAAGIDPRFQKSLESAVQMPEDSDSFFLFPGEEAAASSGPRSASERRGARNWLPLAAGVLAVFAGIIALAARLRSRTASAERGSHTPESPQKSAAPLLLGGQFQLGRAIGHGGMGVVYEGKDLSLDRRVAVKRMRDEIRNDRRERARFLAEAKTVAKLSHPHIVSIHSIVEQEGEIYLVFEFVEGRDLSQLLAEETSLPFGRAVKLFRELASGLDYAHQKGVIHRDLKPSNLMLDREGHLRIMDFGVARITQEAVDRVSVTKNAVGTPLYMAPESARGIVRKESDVYSMAICLFEALTGRRPFVGVGEGMLLNKMKPSYTPASQLNPELPKEIDGAFAQVFDPDPDRRPSGAGDWMALIDSLKGSQA